MNTFLVFVATNAILVTLLFGAITICKPLIRNPVILHWLFLLVLIKLLTPPIWTPQWKMLPAESFKVAAAPEVVPLPVAARSERMPDIQGDELPFQGIAMRGSVPGKSVLGKSAAEKSERETAVEDGSLVTRHSDSGRMPVSASSPTVAANVTAVSASGFDPLILVAVIWAIGTFFIWGLAAFRIVRLERCLRFAECAPEELQAMANRLAEQLGLRSSPPVLLVPGAVSPMLWAYFGRARIVVPKEFFGKLDSRAQESLLLHELAHYRR